MIAILKSVLAVLFCALMAAAPVRADEAQDRLVEQGVAAYDAGHYAEAKSILLPLAEAGHPWAMNMLGLMAMNGLGFSADPKVGCDWYERSAVAGYRSAMYNVATCYYAGNGRPQNDDLNRKWLKKSADHGDKTAMIHLAGMDKAHRDVYRYWMNMAKDQGSRYAMFALWHRGYKQDVPDLSVRDIVCVVVNILILDGDHDDCD